MPPFFNNNNSVAQDGKKLAKGDYSMGMEATTIEVEVQFKKLNALVWVLGAKFGCIPEFGKNWRVKLQI